LIFEFRSYEAQPGRLGDLDRRFRDLTWPIMARHGFQQVGFWKPEDTNELVYVLKWQDRAQAEAAWKAFGADPDWQKGKAASETNGPLLVKTSSKFWNACEYSEAR
jgi:heme-degrading monooxygenase HmoA